MAKKETEKKNEEVIETLAQTLSEAPAQEETETLEAAPATMFSYGLGELMVMEDLDSRIFYLDEEVSEDTFRNLTMFIIKKNIEDANIPVEQRIPIKIVINCYGGDVFNGLGLVDVIRESITPVFTVVIGYACSMAFYVAALGNVRFAMPNSIFLNHDGQTFIGNSSSKFRDEVKFFDRIDERLDKMLASRSKLTIKQIQDEKRVEQYMFADEAKDLGVIDYIIGEDIDFEEIFGVPVQCECEDCHGDCDGKKES